MESSVLNLLVPTQAVGLLIGKNGSGFRNINQATSVNINFQSSIDIPDQNFQRILSLQGDSFLSVLLALSMVIDKLQLHNTHSVDDEESTSSNQQILKWIIPQNSCGVLIGRGGDGIRRINDMTGAWVKVAHIEEFRQCSTERLVYIRGTPEQTVAALRIIRHKVGGRRYVEDELVVTNANTDGLQVPIESFLYIFGPYIVTRSSTDDISVGADGSGTDTSGSKLRTVSDDSGQNLSKLRSSSSFGSTSHEDSENDLSILTQAVTGRSKTSEDFLFSSASSVIICDCKIYFEPRLDLGHRFVFIHIEGDVDHQREALNIITDRLQTWQAENAAAAAAGTVSPNPTSAGSTARSVASGVTSTSSPGLSALNPAYDPILGSMESFSGLPGSGANGASSPANAAADIAIGITLAISAEIAFIFEPELDESILETPAGTLVRDVILRHSSIYQDLRKMCIEKNCMFQLLPQTTVALSRKFELRKLALMAPRTAILIEYMSGLFKYIARLTDEVLFMPLLPLQGDQVPKQPPPHEKAYGVQHILGGTYQTGMEYPYYEDPSAMQQYHQAHNHLRGGGAGHYAGGYGNGYASMSQSQGVMYGAMGQHQYRRGHQHQQHSHSMQYQQSRYPVPGGAGMGSMSGGYSNIGSGGIRGNWDILGPTGEEVELDINGYPDRYGANRHQSMPKHGSVIGVDNGVSNYSPKYGQQQTLGGSASLYPPAYKLETGTGRTGSGAGGALSGNVLGLGASSLTKQQYPPYLEQYDDFTIEPIQQQPQPIGYTRPPGRGSQPTNYSPSQYDASAASFQSAQPNSAHPQAQRTQLSSLASSPYTTPYSSSPDSASGGNLYRPRGNSASSRSTTSALNLGSPSSSLVVDSIEADSRFLLNTFGRNEFSPSTSTTGTSSGIAGLGLTQDQQQPYFLPSTQNGQLLRGSAIQQPIRSYSPAPGPTTISRRLPAQQPTTMNFMSQPGSLLNSRSTLDSEQQQQQYSYGDGLDFSSFDTFSAH